MRDGFVRSGEDDVTREVMRFYDGGSLYATLLLRIFTNLIECCRYARKTPASARHLRRLRNAFIVLLARLVRGTVIATSRLFSQDPRTARKNQPLPRDGLSQ